MPEELRWPRSAGRVAFTVALVALLVVAVAIGLWVIAGLSAGFLVADLRTRPRSASGRTDGPRSSTQ
jgi:hypothetical protein